MSMITPKLWVIVTAIGLIIVSVNCPYTCRDFLYILLTMIHIYLNNTALPLHPISLIGG